MKKPYQIEAQRAIKQLDAMAADGNPAVQMMLPLAEMVGWLRKGVGELIRQAGLQLVDLLMQEELLLQQLVVSRTPHILLAWNRVHSHHVPPPSTFVASLLCATAFSA